MCSNKAIAAKDVVVIDKQRATAAKRGLFGFSIPDFGGLFGGGDDEVKQIASTATRIGHNADGGWVVILADGSTWSQTDDCDARPRTRAGRQDRRPPRLVRGVLPERQRPAGNPGQADRLGLARRRSALRLASAST